MTDKAWTKIQLTDNIDLFTLFIDPKFIADNDQKEEIINILTPIISDHLCVQYWVQLIDKKTCIQNVQDFTKKDLLPNQETYYTFSWSTLLYMDNQEYTNRIQEVQDQFNRNTVESLIGKRLDEMIRTWMRESNYIGFYESSELITALKQSPFDSYITVIDNAYVYLTPSNITNEDNTWDQLQNIFRKHGTLLTTNRISALMQPQEIRYIRLSTNINSKIAMRIREAKRNTYTHGIDTYGTPLLHGVGLEEYQERYYPHGTFMSNILGYVTKEDESYYGVEEYFDTQLRGKDGNILGMATPWIGDIGANSFEISQPVDGQDITLTIDPVIQKEIENTASFFHKSFRADSVSITIIDPHTWHLKWLANAPGFDPNNYNASYKLRPLNYDERYILDDLTYIDIPVYTLSWEQLIPTTTETRSTPWQKKYIFDNFLWPQVFVDKNISFPYEPGSVFKLLTLAIWIDSDAIGLYEFYQDDGKVNIWPYTIANVSSKCLGFNTYAHALSFSCNVWMVRIAQSMTKYVFYEYLKQLWFGRQTWIELAGEEPGTLPDFNSVSLARFFNNAFGQWLLATPMQMAVAYSAAINGWEYIQPTLVSNIYDPSLEENKTLSKKHGTYVFSSDTSAKAKEALVWVVKNWWLQKFYKEGYSLWWKTGTSEIAYKWKYQWGAWWTNGSLVWLVTAETSRYIIAIQVRRPRTSPWGSDTAGRIFGQVSEFLLAYDAIDE